MSSSIKRTFEIGAHTVLHMPTDDRCALEDRRVSRIVGILVWPRGWDDARENRIVERDVGCHPIEYTLCAGRICVQIGSKFCQFFSCRNKIGTLFGPITASIRRCDGLAIPTRSHHISREEGQCK